MATRDNSTTPDDGVVTTTENIVGADNTVPVYPEGDDKAVSFTLAGGTKVTAEKRVADTLKTSK